MTQRLGRVTGRTDALEFVTRQIALWPPGAAEPHFDEILMRVGEGRIDTPAGSLETVPGVYTEVTDECLATIETTTEAPFFALVSLQGVRQLMGIVDDVDEATFEFFGDRDRLVADEIRVRAGETTVRFESLATPDDRGSIPMSMPTLFDDGRLALADGDPAPTVAETTAAALERVVDTVEALSGETVPIVIDEEGPAIDVARDNVFVTAPLQGELVEGPPVHNVYGPALATAIRTLEGDVTVQTAPEGPIALVREGPGYTVRVVVDHR